MFPTMEHGACNVVYLDRRASEETVRKDSVMSREETTEPKPREELEYFKLELRQPQHTAEIMNNIESILSTFNEVHVVCSGASCLAKLQDLYESKSTTPTVVLIDIPYDEEQRLKRLSREPRTPSPTSTRTRRVSTEYFEPEDIYGIHLLNHISSSIHSKVLPKLVVPVVMLSGFEREWASSNLPSPSVHGSQVLADTVRLTRYVDAGAVDVLTSPMSKTQIQGLAVHAYRVYREVSRDDQSFLAQKQNRKLSWVGVDETRPYAYLREAMVSTLMSGICNPELAGESHNPSDVKIEPERHAAIAESLADWSFSAHEFSDDELLNGALIMLKHALQMPELERWRMSTDDLTKFLQASRAAYNDFVLYHNFRHVVDVLQAIFVFLVQIGTLPPYPHASAPPSGPQSPIASIIKPFDALTLMISAIGHDVGHPGVSNAFLVALNAPLAQLYNDRSVLESFHCAAFSQILRRFWPSAFQDIKMRKLMINSILATDMGVHFKYMSDLGNLQEKLAHNKNTLDGWNVKILEEYRDLACGLLIKCADISNVGRKFGVAAEWARILTDEFSNQGNMEKELDIPTQLFGGPPERDNVVKLGESQIGFMNIFARPLFEGVTDIFPTMQFTVDELIANRVIWEQKIEDEKLGCPDHHTTLDGMASPMTRSHTDLPSTNNDTLGSPVSPLTANDTQVNQSRRGSADASVTAFIVRETPSSPVDSHHQKRTSSLNPFSNARTRSTSPSKRKQKSRSSSRKADADRPRTSPSNPPTELYDSPPVPKGHLNARSQPDLYSQANGTVDEPMPTQEKSKGYLANITSSDGADSTHSSPKKTKFLSKLWKRRWRPVGISHTLQPHSLPPPQSAEERDGSGRRVGKEDKMKELKKAESLIPGKPTSTELLTTENA